MQDKYWGWLALIIIFLVFRAWRALWRSVNKPDAGLARLNAAAERILKERGASPSNPIPRTMPQKRSASAAEKPKPQSSALKARSTPAVIRRDGLLSSGGQEPVIQRRR